MKKSYAFNILSATKTCSCGKRIKKRFEDNNNHMLCFECYVKSQKLKGHVMSAHMRLRSNLLTS